MRASPQLLVLGLTCLCGVRVLSASSLTPRPWKARTLLQRMTLPIRPCERRREQ